MRYEHIALTGNHRDMDEVADGIVTHGRKRRGCKDVRAMVSHQQRVAIGIRAGDLGGAESATATHPVLDVELLLEAPGQLLRGDTGHAIDRTAARERIDQPDRPGGPFLREGRSFRGQQHGGEQHNARSHGCERPRASRTPDRPFACIALP